MEKKSGKAVKESSENDDHGEVKEGEVERQKREENTKEKKRREREKTAVVTKPGMKSNQNGQFCEPSELSEH